MVKIKEIMRKNVVTIGPETTVREVSKIMSTNKIGSVVIMGQKEPSGIITADDVTKVVSDGLNPDKTKVSEIVNKTLVTASPEDNILSVTKVMVKKGIKRVPVVTEGQLVGIISEKDIMLAAPEMIDVLSERLKARVESAVYKEHSTSGLCEDCGGYSDDLRHVNGEWVCEDCRNG